MIVLIQARLSSKRFPNKALYKIKELPLIIHQINRIKNSKNIKEIIVATSIEKSDNELCLLLKKNKIKFYRGNLNNVAFRLYKTAKKYRAKYFVRISGDSPLIDYKIINLAQKELKKNPKVDIVTNVFPRSFPSGQSVEIIRTKLLKLYNPMMNSYEKEHVTTFFYKRSDKFKIKNFKNTNPKMYDKSIKFSVDYKTDLKKIMKYF